MVNLVYKVLSASAWTEAEQAGFFIGSADDCRDGFIHLSTGPQLARILLKFFTRRDDLVLVTYEAASLGAALRWETSGSGQTYPHYYGQLPVAAAVSVQPLTLGDDGIHILPGDMNGC